MLKCGIYFVYKHFVYILYTNLSKCGIHFVYRHFVYILHTKCIQKFVEIWDTFCIYQCWSTESVHHKHYVYNLYTKFKQNLYINNCMQNGSLISTCFDPFVVHFLVNHCKQLRPETCWLITGDTQPIKLMNYWIIHCIKLPVIKLSKSKSPCVSGKNAKLVLLAS